MASMTKTNASYTVPKVVMLSIATLILGAHIVGCARGSVGGLAGERKMPVKTIEAVLDEHTDEWMSIPGVVGTAIGESKGKPCIKILVVEKTEQLTEKIPSEIEGFPVVIQQTGTIRALE